MSKEVKRELAAFLAALPDYQRKSFESGLSSLTQDEMLQWADWIASPAGTSALYSKSISVCFRPTLQG